MSDLTQYTQDSFYFNLRLSPLLTYNYQGKTHEYMEVFNGFGKLTLKVKSRNFTLVEKKQQQSPTAKAPCLVKMLVEEGSAFYTVKKALELDIGAPVCAWHEGNAYLNCSQSVFDDLKLLSDNNADIIFSLHLERIAITNWQPRCRFIIESAEREAPALAPPPATKRIRKNAPKKKPATNAVVTALTSTIEPTLSCASELLDWRDVDAFLTANDSQTRE